MRVLDVGGHISVRVYRTRTCIWYMRIVGVVSGSMYPKLECAFKFEKNENIYGSPKQELQTPVRAYSLMHGSFSSLSARQSKQNSSSYIILDISIIGKV